jgi:hypothetical protein
MKKEKKLILSFLFMFLATIIGMFAISLALAADANYCCEKTTSGAWCQNAPQSQCDSNFKTSPTSCDSTSYCKSGCCFDSQEGICMENTPQRVCQDSNATWANEPSCNIAQCNLGCCILADQGAFVTLARCRALSGFYGLKTDFRKNILDEVTCIATAQGDDQGACVYEDTETLGKTCKFTSRSKCPTASSTSQVINLTSINSSSNQTAGLGFYKDILCTAQELGVNCAKTQDTILIAGKDEIYFVDTCGQPANIYDASRYTDNQYWKKIYKKSESCGYGASNANSKDCGNCDYYLGSIGKLATRSSGFATYGDYICADLSCKTPSGEKKKHGESWCETDSPTGDGLDTVGSRYFKEVCLNGEILTEPCADFRNQICIEDSFNGFSEAACRVNRWQDCSAQLEDADCTNNDQRDCKWIGGYYFSSNSGQIEKTNNDTKKGALTPTGLCVPNYPPGSAFWGSTSTGRITPNTTTTGANRTSAFPAAGQTSAYGTGYVNPSSSSTSTISQCSAGNSKITFKWTKVTKPLMFFSGSEQKGEWSCDQTTGNCQYMTNDDEKNANLSQATIDRWSDDMNQICYTLGDCGGYINWVGQYTDDGFASYTDGRRVAGSGGAEILEASKTVQTAATNAIGGTRASATTATTGTNTGGLFGTGLGATGNVVKDMIKSKLGIK